MRAYMAVGLAGILAGCVSSGTKVTAEQVSAFEVGKTTESQVIALLGKPNGSSVAPDGTKADVYMHVSARANGASYIPIVGLFAGGATSDSESAVFTFGPDGLLKTTSTSTGHSDVNTGIANQK